MNILFADDDPDMRALLGTCLKSWGYSFFSAQTGRGALNILSEKRIDMVISDWVMPEMTGIELCRRIRSGEYAHYIYIILLTAKSRKNDIVEGMEAGADDFVVKPFNRDELKVRIKAGERIIVLEENLLAKNRELTEAYSIIRKDLQAAALLQQEMLPSRSVRIGSLTFGSLLIPCSFVAGDIFNFFALDEQTVAFYLLDVAGHGIPSAMLSVSISNLLSPLSRAGSIVRTVSPDGTTCLIQSPESVAKELNDRFQSEGYEVRYFTLVYGLVDTVTFSVTLIQAGHPPCILVHADGSSIIIEGGGFPIGMIPGAEYEETTFTCASGDRLILYSDGVTECENQEGSFYSRDRLKRFLGERQSLPVDNLVKELKMNLRAWRGHDEFNDDVSLLMIGFDDEN